MARSCRYLLPQGRETLTVGDITVRLLAGGAFSQRLLENGAGTPLGDLGTTVSVWYGQGHSLRTQQVQAINQYKQARASQEDVRVLAAEALYAMVGLGMVVFKKTSAKVDTLFDVNLMRATPQVVPAAAGPAAWDEAARRLSTAVLPAGATRLDAWRLGPGGTPELLGTGEFEEPWVVVPAAVTWDAGDLYQLWLVGRNARGTGEPGTSVSWTAP